MVFSSVSFLFFFLPVFLAAYFLTPTVIGKNVTALVFSLVFYAWGEAWFLPGLLGAIAFNTLAALCIDRLDGRARGAALGVAVTANLALLATFKYAGFLVGNLDTLLRPFGAGVTIPVVELPLGISFFTFHCLSYIIDVYRRRFPANRNPLEVALYIALFPQLVAGPIVRYGTVARQLHARRHTLGRASAGAQIFIIGLAQKVLVADQVAHVVEIVFDQTKLPTLPEAWTGLLAYTVQIYFDFSGYSNMAVGLGLILGFTFPRNFRLPYQRAVDHRVLASLAHVAVQLVARLSVYSAGRQSGRRAAHLSQPCHRVSAVRALAWRELDVRALGRLAWGVPGCRARGSRRCAAAPAGTAAMGLCAAGGDGWLGIVPVT